MASRERIVWDFHAKYSDCCLKKYIVKSFILLTTKTEGKERETEWQWRRIDRGDEYISQKAHPTVSSSNKTKLLRTCKWQPPTTRPPCQLMAPTSHATSSYTTHQLCTHECADGGVLTNINHLHTNPCKTGNATTKKRWRGGARCFL